MQALVSAWAVSRQQKVMGKPKPVPNADGWQIYWVKRGNSSTAGDNYFISPRGNKLASLTASRRWLNMFCGAVVAGINSEAIDNHGRVIKEQPKEKRREACRLLAVAELQVGGDGTVRLQLMAATAAHRLERLIALRAEAVQDERLPNFPISRRGMTVRAQLVVASDGLVALQLRCGALRAVRRSAGVPPTEWWRGKAQVPAEAGADGGVSQLGRPGGACGAPPPKPVKPPRLGARVRLAGGAVGVVSEARMVEVDAAWFKSVLVPRGVWPQARGAGTVEVLQQRVTGEAAGAPDHGWHVFGLEPFTLLGRADVAPEASEVGDIAAGGGQAGGRRRGVKRRAEEGGWLHMDEEPALGACWHCFKRVRSAAPQGEIGARSELIYISPNGFLCGSLAGALRQQQLLVDGTAECGLCGSGEVCAGNDILLCDSPDCGRSFHQQCLVPPLQTIPEGDWICPVCSPEPPGANAGTGPPMDPSTTRTRCAPRRPGDDESSVGGAGPSITAVARGTKRSPRAPLSRPRAPLPPPSAPLPRPRAPLPRPVTAPSAALTPVTKPANTQKRSHKHVAVAQSPTKQVSVGVGKPDTEPMRKADGDRCQRNPLCKRGFNHGGSGGHCSVHERKQSASSRATGRATTPAPAPHSTLPTRASTSSGVGGSCSSGCVSGFKIRIPRDLSRPAAEPRASLSILAGRAFLAGGAKGTAAAAVARPHATPAPEAAAAKTAAPRDAAAAIDWGSVDFGDDGDASPPETDSWRRQERVRQEMLQLSGGAKRQKPAENMPAACAVRTQQQRVAAAKEVAALSLASSGLPAPVGLDAVSVAVRASAQMAATAPGVISWRWGPSSSPPPSLPPSPAHEEDDYEDDDDEQAAEAGAEVAAEAVAEGAAEAGAEAAEAAKPAPLTCEDAIAQAAAEGLILEPSSNGTTGYKGVHVQSYKGANGLSTFGAYVTRAGKQVHLGSYVTAEEAALAVARKVAAGAKQASLAGQTPASVPAAEAATHLAKAAAPRRAGRHTEPEGNKPAGGRASGRAGERHTERGAATLATGVKAGNAQHVEGLLGRAADQEVVEMVRQHQLLHVGV